MICRRCGYTYSDQLDECPICDEPRVLPAQSALPAPAVSQRTTVMPAAENGDSTPLILGILGFIGIMGLVPAILAVIFGRRAFRMRPPGTPAHMLGRAGYRLGIVGLVFQACVIVYLIFVVQAVADVALEQTMWAAIAMQNIPLAC